LPDLAAPVPARRGSKVWLWVGLGLGAAAAALVGVRARGTKAAPPAAPDARPVPVTFVTASSRDVPIYLDGLGNAMPLATVTVRSQVDGRLDKVLFREGQEVKKGELLAQIDPRPFSIQLHQAEAALAKDTAQLNNAQVNLDRYEALVQQKLVAQQQVDDQRALRDQYAASAKADQAQVENARLQLDYAQLKSPIDGITGVRQIDPGNLVHAADTSGIVVVTQLDPIAVIFTLPQDDLGEVAQAMAQGPVDVEAYGRDGTDPLARGKLLLIDNQVNQQTATIKLKASFPNASHALWPNAFVKARLLLATRKQATVVAASAVQRGPQGSFVYVVGNDQTASMRPVEVDVVQGQVALIKKGIAPGEKVVIEGQNQLKPGGKVAPRSAEKPDSSAAPASSGRPGKP
jgi:multidrug efflux system membrane fusion protein